MLTRARTILTCAAAAAAAGLAAGTAAPALATARPAPRAVAGPGGALRLTHHDHATGPTATPANSRYFAGYQATVPAGSATVTGASFTVPALSCTTADRAVAPDVGVLANNYKTVSIAGVITGCVNGTASYIPSVVVNGAR
jgi:hypothetical protein